MRGVGCPIEVSRMGRLVELQVGEESCVSLIANHTYHVGRLDGVDVHGGGLVDQSLVFPGPHPSIDVEGFRAHPSAYEHDHRVWDVGGMESRGEPRPEGVPRVECGDRGSVEVGECQPQEVV